MYSTRLFFCLQLSGDTLLIITTIISRYLHCDPAKRSEPRLKIIETWKQNIFPAQELKSNDKCYREKNPNQNKNPINKHQNQNKKPEQQQNITKPTKTNKKATF